MNLIYVILIAVGLFIVLILAGLAVVNYSGEEMYEKYKQTANVYSNISALEFANKIINTLFFGEIVIEERLGLFCDCYISSGKLVLSQNYSRENNLAGLAICAHELGHALQFKNQKEKMKKYAKKLKISKILSKFITPIIILSIILIFFDKLFFSLIGLGMAIIIFITALAVKMSTIKIEKEASENAITLLQNYTDLTMPEIEIANTFLDSAKLTYVADLLKSMLRWTGLTRR